MPTLRIQTSASLDEASIGSLLDDASTAVARGLGKPEKYVQVIFEPIPHMLFSGSADPSAWVSLASIGLTREQVHTLTPLLTRILSQALEVPSDRFYLNFEAIDPAHCALGGKTFG